MTRNPPKTLLNPLCFPLEFGSIIPLYLSQSSILESCKYINIYCSSLYNTSTKKYETSCVGIKLFRTQLEVVSDAVTREVPEGVCPSLPIKRFLIRRAQSKHDASPPPARRLRRRRLLCVPFSFHPITIQALQHRRTTISPRDCLPFKASLKLSRSSSPPPTTPTRRHVVNLHRITSMCCS